MELLIVLAVVSTVIGMAVPSLRKFSERGYLQDAARQLRGQLLSARLQAIESASSRFFFYQTDSGAYLVTGAEDALSLIDESGDLFLGDDVADEPVEYGRSGDESSDQMLPADIRFVARDMHAVGGAAADQTTSSHEGVWSEPLIFYPNGRALNTRIRLASDRYWIELTVRGLTGTVQLSPVQRLVESSDLREESPP
jgi:type II secretory pathway pseudopilin PulG